MTPEEKQRKIEQFRSWAELVGPDLGAGGDELPVDTVDEESITALDPNEKNAFMDAMEVAKARRSAEARRLEAQEQASEVVDKAAAFGRGAVRGLAEFGPFALSAAEGTVNFLGKHSAMTGGKNPDVNFGSEKLDHAQNEFRANLGLVDERPREDIPFSEKATDFAGEAFGASIPAEGALLTLGAASKTGSMLSKIQKHASEKPLSFAVGELASMAGEGGGRAVAESMLPDSGWADMILGVTGAFTPGAVSATGRYVRDTGRGILSVAMPSSGSAKAAVDTNARRMASGETTDSAEAIRKIGRLEEIQQSGFGKDIDPTTGDRTGPQRFNPTAGQTTGDPGLLDLEKRVTGDDAQFRGRLVAQQKESVQAVVREVELRAPPGDPQSVEDLALRRASEVADELQPEIDAAVTNVRDRMRVATEGMLPEDASIRGVDIIAQESDRAFLPLKNRYNLNDGRALAAGIEIDGSPLSDAVAAINRETGAASKGTIVPKKYMNFAMNAVQDIADDGSIVPKDASLFEVRDLQKALTERISEIIQPGGTGQGELPFLYKLKEATNDILQDFIENPPDGFPEAAEIAQEYRDIGQAYAEVSRRFRGAITGSVVARADGITAEQLTLARYFKPNIAGKKSMGRFLEATRDSPEGRAAMKAYIVGQAIDQSLGFGPDPLIRADALEKFKRKHRAALSMMPDAAREVDNVLRLQRTADDYVGRQARSIKEYQRSRLALFTSKENPASAVAAVQRFKNPDQQRKAMNDLLREMEGDADAIAGLRRTFWDELVASNKDYVQTGAEWVPFIDPAKMVRNVESARPALEILFGREHMKNVDMILEAATIISSKGGATAQVRGSRGNSKLARWFAGTSGLKAIYSRFYSGRVRATIVARAVHTLMGNISDVQAADLLQQILSDPPLMKTVLIETTNQTDRLVARKIRGSLISLGHRVSDEDEGNENQ